MIFWLFRSTIICVFNHRYDGLQLWQVQGVQGVKPLVWSLSALSFLALLNQDMNINFAHIQKSV
jgi:uncharacterized membrane protein